MILSVFSLFYLLSLASGLKTATVVGSGPIGLASAMVLAKRHGYQVTVLESAERTDVYDPRKGYPFQINQRGQLLTKLFPSLLHERLIERGVAASANSIVSIPSDPKEVVDLKPKEINVARPKETRFWIRRHEFTKILLDAVAETENIQIVNRVSCREIKAESDSEITVCVESKNEKSGSPVLKEYKSSLVIGADGMNSAVRESLSKPESSLKKWVNGNPKGFKVKRWK